MIKTTDRQKCKNNTSKLFLYLLFFSMPLICQANWSLKKEYRDTSIYVSPDSTRLTLNFKSMQKPIELDKVNSSLIQETTKDKKKMLAIIGITNWIIKDSRVERKKKKGNVVFEVLVRLSGHYNDPNGELVHFTEYHYYRSKNKLQMLLTNPNKNKLQKDARLSRLRKFRRQYGFL